MPGWWIPGAHPPGAGPRGLSRGASAASPRALHVGARAAARAHRRRHRRSARRGVPTKSSRIIARWSAASRRGRTDNRDGHRAGAAPETTVLSSRRVTRQAGTQHGRGDRAARWNRVMRCSRIATSSPHLESGFIWRSADTRWLVIRCTGAGGQPVPQAPALPGDGSLARPHRLRCAHPDGHGVLNMEAPPPRTLNPRTPAPGGCNRLAGAQASAQESRQAIALSLHGLCGSRAPSELNPRCIRTISNCPSWR